ncbi:MAG: GGDEF domain-containing response regulator [Lachnospiraceae bacterium]
MDSAKTILVVDDAVFITAVIERNLAPIGYNVTIVHTAEDALVSLKKELPDLILLDVVMPGMDGFELCSLLRKNPQYNMIPIIMITGQNDEEDKLQGLELGADDYIVKPFVNQELIARVNNTLTRLERVRNLNPLSWLKGNNDINKEMERRIENGQPFAVLYTDLNGFKAYNDIYGFMRGDDLIRMTANVLTNVIADYGVEDDFVGHIGGDDFVVMTYPEYAVKFAETIIERFETEKCGYFDDQDLEHGYLLSVDRKGVAEKFPLVGVAVAILVCKNQERLTPQDIGQAAAAVKKEVKMLKKSAYLQQEA